MPSLCLSTEYRSSTTNNSNSLLYVCSTEWHYTIRSKMLSSIVFGMGKLANGKAARLPVSCSSSGLGPAGTVRYPGPTSPTGRTRYRNRPKSWWTAVSGTGRWPAGPCSRASRVATGSRSGRTASRRTPKPRAGRTPSASSTPHRRSRSTRSRTCIGFSTSGHCGQITTD